MRVQFVAICNLLFTIRGCKTRHVHNQYHQVNCKKQTAQYQVLVKIFYSEGYSEDTYIFIQDQGYIYYDCCYLGYSRNRMLQCT